jgi:hypothetical protein
MIKTIDYERVTSSTRQRYAKLSYKPVKVFAGRNQYKYCKFKLTTGRHIIVAERVYAVHVSIVIPKSIEKIPEHDMNQMQQSPFFRHTLYYLIYSHISKNFKYIL